MPSCDSPVKLGKTCTTGKPVVKWYYDTKMLYCYPYKYLGCDEGSNSFATQDECFSMCKPADQVSCGGNTDILGNCSPHDGGDSCPAGQICVNGGNIGLCCDKKIQEAWDLEQSPKCKQGSPVQISVWYGKTPLIGRNCSHRFCPDDSKCIQGKWTAHCCK
ncbi:unnamed protein product [Caenorhabditis bovis]|uniref:BPTI/Kunitz inhibitor domain-containing protein n=1 Tax=Caenorhabditis bovis TaxID=2654633 RepID=A0A8S1EI83_9PELO|nr:unnamed protein product [Caenorhabditis bovis]